MNDTSSASAANPETSTRKRTAGKVMLEHLRTIGRAKKQAGKATTAELAAVAGIPVSQAYSRLYWLQTKEGKLESTGKGESRVWRLTKRPRPESSARQDAPEASTESSESTEG